MQGLGGLVRTPGLLGESGEVLEGIELGNGGGPASWSFVESRVGGSEEGKPGRGRGVEWGSAGAGHLGRSEAVSPLTTVEIKAKVRRWG